MLADLRKNADRLIDPELASYNEVGDAAGNWSWYVTLPVTYVVADGPPIDAIESWRVVTDDAGHRIEGFSVDTPIVEREASLAVIDEYIAHVASGDWHAVAALLDDGAVNLDERRDLTELELDDFNLDTIAAALEQWCVTGCDTQPPGVDELSFTGRYGITRDDRRIEAQWFEGAYSISGLPIPLDHDQQD